MRLRHKTLHGERQLGVAEGIGDLHDGEDQRGEELEDALAMGRIFAARASLGIASSAPGAPPGSRRYARRSGRNARFPP